jgi:hypothetical protein
MIDDFAPDSCVECSSILRDLKSALKTVPPLSVVTEDLEDQARRGESFQTFDSPIFDICRRMDQHEIRAGHSLRSFLRSKLPNWPYFG